MEIKNQHLLYIIGTLLICYGAYLFYCYTRPLNNMFTNLMVSIPFSFYDYYDLLQFIFGIFYLFCGILIIFSNEKIKYTEYVMIIFLITLFISFIDYIPLLLQTILGNYTFTQIPFNLILPNIFYLTISILSKMIFQVYICMIIIKLLKNEEILEQMRNFIIGFALFFTIFYSNKLLYFFLESILLSSIVQIVLNWSSILIYASGILFGLYTIFSAIKNKNFFENPSQASLLIPILFAFFLIFQMITSLGILNAVQIVIHVIAQILLYSLAILIYLMKRNS